MFEISDLFFRIWISILVICGFTTLYFLYWLLFRPVNWTKNLTDVGYNFALKNSNNQTMKIDAINRIRRLRSVSDSTLPPPFPNGWFALIESENLLPGQAISVNSLGQNFVVFRNIKRIVNILDAYCPHLGANLGIGGIVRGDCIECPFHQWAFQGSDGKCINVPYSTSEKVPNIGIKKWLSKEINGLIFVWYHAENESPWDLPMIQEIESKEWIYHGRNEFIVNCHIQEIPENGADVAHLATVHGPNMLAGGDLNYSRASWASFGAHTWEARWQACTELGSKHLALINLKHSIRIFNKIELANMDVSAKQIGPSYVQLKMNTSLGTFVILQTVTPVEHLLQKVVHRFYGPRYMAAFIKFVLWGESVMFERDIMIWNHKIYVNTPHLVKEDRTIKLYRNWYSQFYSKNSKTFSQAKESIEW